MSRDMAAAMLEAAGEALERSAHDAGGDRQARRRLARQLQKRIEQGVRERLGAGAPRKHRREIGTIAAALAVFLTGAGPAAAATSAVRDGTLEVVSEAGEALRIECLDGLVKVNGADPGSGEARCAEVRAIRVAGTGGDDVIDLSGVSAAAGFAAGDFDRPLVIGMTGHDTVVGSAFDDELRGGDGNDRLTGAAGNDTLLADLGDDALAGGVGNDTIGGAAGNDTLIGDLGDDALLAGIGIDVLTAGEGHNLADGGEGFDHLVEAAAASSPDATFTLSNTLLSAADRETELAGIDAVTLIGGSGNDVMDARQATLPLDLTGGTGNDTLLGGLGEDRVFGREDDDLVTGGAGNDTLEGAAGNDTILGDLGDDALSGGAGQNELVGGDGNDTVSEDVRGSAVVTNSRIEFDPAMALMSGIEQVDLRGGPKGDTIDATEATLELRLAGRAGSDTIASGSGNDSLIGNSGADLLVGGFGNDVVVAGAGDDTLLGGFGSDTLLGGPGEDVIEADADDRVAEDPGRHDDRRR